MTSGGALQLYEVAAQLMPLLWAVYVLELRMLGVWWITWQQEANPDPRAFPLGAAVAGTVLTLLFVVVEFTALTALADGEPNAAQQEIVLIGSFVAVLIVMGMPLWAFVDAILARAPIIGPWRVRLSGFDDGAAVGSPGMTQSVVGLHVVQDGERCRELLASLAEHLHLERLTPDDGGYLPIVLPLDVVEARAAVQRGLDAIGDDWQDYVRFS